MPGIISELKRRNVFRVGIAYAMLCWVVVQITDVVVPALNLPETLNTIVVYLAIIGFPFALFFAWAFELTPDGLKRSEEVDAETSQTSETGRKIEHIALGLMTVAVILLLWNGYFSNGEQNISTGTSSESALNSIAVLPFVNMSTDPEQEFFSDGISEEILNVLAKIPGLHVTSRSSAFSFKGKDITIPDVAEQLGVSTVLEGSVRKAGTRVRITAQLIQADGDKHLWSETYDRELDDIFAIQDEISTAIVDQLRTHLGLSENVELAAQIGLSQNTEAYEAYLKGRHLLQERTNESINAAVRNFEYALSLDPDFVLAHAELAIAYILLIEGQYGDQPIAEAQALATPHANRAMELAPDHPDVLAAAGFVLWNFRADTETIDYFNRVLEINPNHATVINWLANIEEERGEYKVALALREKLMQLDPLGVSHLYNLTFLYTMMGRYADSEAIVEKLKIISPGSAHQANAAILFDQSKFLNSLNEIFLSLAADPQSGLRRMNLSYWLASMGLYEEAKVSSALVKYDHMYSGEQYQAIIDELSTQTDELNSEEKRLLGLSYAAIGNYQAALPLLEEIWIAYGQRSVSVGNGINFRDMEVAALVAARRNVQGDADISDLRNALLNEIIRLNEGGIAEKYINIIEATIAWIDQDYELAIFQLGRTDELYTVVNTKNIDYLSDLYARDGFIKLASEANERTKGYRDTFLSEICKSNPYENFWTPLPETCEGYGEGE